MYEVVLSLKAEKFLDSLNVPDRERILTALGRLRIRPEAHLSKLVGENIYKFRIGDYRALVDLHENLHRIAVIKIGHRKNIYDLSIK